METDEKKQTGGAHEDIWRIRRKLTRFKVNLAGEGRDGDSRRHLVKVDLHIQQNGSLKRT